ncbi:hypothetical protein VIGAN_06182300 [Vigna angularis var. angularis]|uniref:Cyclic nucleotide-binding domain-containing protein n=1 Tax=Vigna angularis var. angularis TaxID=157739 RepID=A0A0S3SCH5_PHAAN|nr:protein CNGC15c isoform X2 [Vigna angularis]BAT90559.1 hypothetical protein VIGAN_06182300 [Vigna angularis var. angularis]
MASDCSRFVRFQDDPELVKLPTANSGKGIRNNGTRLAEIRGKKGLTETRKFLKARVLSRVFSEDYERVRKKTLLDPRGQTIHRWNKIFLVVCLVSLFVDPLFFYLPLVRDEVCIDIGTALEVFLTMIRSMADVFYMIQILMKFRTAYVAPSSRVFGRGELVIGTTKIATRYLRKGFGLDFIAALPLPQVLIWIVIPNLGGSTMANTKNVLRFIIIFQYLPRLFLIFPLSSQIVKATGVVTETAWAGAVYNLVLYMLASHVLGASWYLLSIERQEACWRSVCDMEQSCQYGFFDCKRVEDSSRVSWFIASNITLLCSPKAKFYQFGIYGDAVASQVTTSSFFHKYFFCLWWGLRNLSSLGQGLLTSTFVGEIMFAIVVATLGLVLFALLIGNMQVPLFDQMDERMLDAICERLKPALCTENTYLVREGDPVNETLFIIRGHLDSYTTNGGRTGFFNSCRIGPGDFCGEELLTWALGPRPSFILPSSTRTVKAISEVEAFALIAEDLKFVASQFRRLHSKQLRHKFRFYSHQWRTWAACFIQAAWRRYKKRKEAAEVRDLSYYVESKSDSETVGLVAYGTRMTRKGSVHSDEVVNALQKPEEPDFSLGE